MIRNCDTRTWKCTAVLSKKPSATLNKVSKKVEALPTFLSSKSSKLNLTHNTSLPPSEKKKMRIKPPPRTLLIPTIPTIPKTHRPLLLPPPFFFLLPNLNNPRTLTSTAPLLKKGGKQDSKRTVPHNAAIALAHSHSQSGDGNDDPEAPSEAAAIDAFDFTDYKAAIERAHEHLRGQLGTIRASGGGGGRRGSAEEIEGARVWLGGKGGGRGKKKEEEGEEGEEARVVKLGDVASVVARGRNVGVLVGEKKVRFLFYLFLSLTLLLSYSYSYSYSTRNPPTPKRRTTC